MHKKLLLVMLVPILALSLIVVGCGDDDDGFYEGSPTFRGMQGSWVSDWVGLDVRESRWFTISANQLNMYDLNTLEGGLNFRVGFSELAHSDVRRDVPARDAAGIDQLQLLIAMNYFLVNMLNSESEHFFDASEWPLVTMANPTAWGFGAPDATNVVGNLGATLHSLGQGLSYDPVLWATIQDVNATFVGYTGFRGIENWFRRNVGISFDSHFHHQDVIGFFLDHATVREQLRFVEGFLSPPSPVVVGYGVIGVDGTNTPLLMNDPRVPFGGNLTPRRIVPFEWTLRHWETNREEANLHGLWVDWDANPHNQQIIILGTRDPDFWQTHMPLPLGVFSRGVPQGE